MKEKKEKKRGIKRWCIVIAAIAVLIIFIAYENTNLSVTYYGYSSRVLPESFDGYSIAQISDLHNTEFGKDNCKLIEKVQYLDPDIIVVTGDMIDSKHTDIDVAISTMKSLSEITDVYFVTGNHECWVSQADRERLLDGLEKSGAVVLRDEEIMLQKEDSSIRIVGLDDKGITKKHLIETVEKKDSNCFTVLLSHEPLYFDWYAEAGADIVFTGHEHGGQFRLPVVGAVFAPDQGFNPEFTEGEHVKNNTTMYISRGLGNSVIPFRIFNNPEIVYVKLSTPKGIE